MLVKIRLKGFPLLILYYLEIVIQQKKCLRVSFMIKKKKKKTFALIADSRSSLSYSKVMNDFEIKGFLMAVS